jgi:hypothetical protein
MGTILAHWEVEAYKGSILFVKEESKNERDAMMHEVGRVEGYL